MYGVPADLDLDIFTGAGLEQVCVGQFHVQFNFEGGRSIGVEGRWQILGQRGDPFADVARGAIGAAVADRLREAGHRVAGLDVRAAQDVVACDVTDADAVDAAVDSIVDELGPIRVLVHSAGITGKGSVEQEPPGPLGHGRPGQDQVHSPAQRSPQ